LETSIDKGMIMSGCGGTLLLVGNEPALLRIAQVMLEESGCRVIVADNPGEAIRLAEAHAGGIELLVTDVVMPEMNGRDLAKWLHFFHPDMKTLFMSGYSVDIMFYQGALADEVNFIQKPFSLHELAVKVQHVLQSAAPG